MEDKAAFDPTQALSEARKLFDELNPVDKWKLESNKNDVKVYTRQDQATGLNMARGESIIKQPVDYILPAIQDDKTLLEWDDSLIENKVLESNKDYFIIRSVNRKKTALVTQRETLIACQIYTLDNGATLFLGKSVEHPSYPPRTEYVRAEIHVWGWLLTPDQSDPEKTHALYIVFMDPKGWVPTVAFNAIISQQAQNARKLKEFIEASE